MEMKDVITNSICNQISGALMSNPYQMAQESPEVIAKMKAEREAQERRYRNTQVLGAVIDVATALVKTGTNPIDALNKAEEFYHECKEYAEKFEA